MSLDIYPDVFRYGATFVLALLIIYFYQKGRKQKVKTIWNGKELPVIKWFPISIPILDGFISLLQLRKQGVQMAEDAGAKYGMLCRVPFAQTTAIGVADPEVLQKVLSSTKRSHLNKPQNVFDKMLVSFMRDGLFGLEVGEWTRHRKAINQAFTYKSFLVYLNFMDNGCRCMVEQAGKNLNSNRTIHQEQMKPLIAHHAVKIMAQIIMGTENFEMTDDDREGFYKSFDKLKQIGLDRFRYPYLLIPPIWALHPMRRELDRELEKISTFFEKVTKNYKMADMQGVNLYKEQRSKPTVAEFSGGADDNDLFSFEQKMKESEAEDEKDGTGAKKFECMVEYMLKAGLSTKAIIDEICTFMAAGHEAVLTAVDMLVYQLARNPHHQKICHKEVDQLFASGKVQGNNLTMNDLSELKYLERCIMEGLRITPSIPFFLRSLESPIDCGPGKYLDEGEMLIVIIWNLHRNPDIYPEPNKFDPDRFLPENCKKRHPYAFIPFSLGARNCIAWKLSLLKLKVIMIWLLRTFELTTTDKMEDVKLFFDLALKPKRQYNVIYHARNNADNLAKLLPVKGL